jgi:hypothetical protein
MPTKPIADIDALIGRRSDSRGLQFAHIIGEAFCRRTQLAWIYPLLPESADLATRLATAANDNGALDAREAA